MNMWNHILRHSKPPHGLDEAKQTIENTNLEKLSLQSLYSSWMWLEIHSFNMKAWTKGTSNDDRRALCVASLNRKGFTREAAIKGLLRFQHPESIPFVLWALRDWVPQVRNAAVITLTAMLIPELAGAFLSQHRLLDQLGNVQRTDLDSSVNRVKDFLLSDVARGAVAEAIISKNPKIRLFAYRLLVKNLTSDRALQAQMATDPEPHVRRWFVSQLDQFDTPTRRAWIERLILDRSTVVACSVIRGLEPALKLDLQKNLTQACFSDSRPIRGAARFAIEGVHRDEFAHLYREKIIKVPINSVKPGWLAGLGETGSITDTTILSPFLISENAKIRSEALRAIAGLDRDAASEPLLQAISDDSGRVRRVAVAVFCADLKRDESESLYVHISNTDDVHVAMASFRVLLHQGRWEAVTAVLFGASREFDAIRNLSWDLGAAWMRQNGSCGWIKPSPVLLPILDKAHHQLQRSNHEPPLAVRSEWNELTEWVKRVCGH